VSVPDPSTAPPLDSFAQELYDRLEPLQYAEAEHDYALRKFCAALGVPFQQVEDLARDQVVEPPPGGFSQRVVHPGWSVLLDIDRVPDEALAWLGQFVGVPLNPDLDSAGNRERIKTTEGWKRGTVGSIVGAAKSVLELKPTYRRVVLDDLPQAYWRLEEKSGDALDHSRHNHPLTVSGSPTRVAGLISNPYEKINFGQRFDAADSDHFNGGDIFDFTGSAQFSLEAWFTINDIGVERGLVSKYQSLGGEGWTLYLDAVSNITFSRFKTGAADTVAYGSIAAIEEAKHHVVGTFDGTNMRLYLDGVLVSGPTVSSKTLVNTSQALYVGRFGDEYWNSIIDEVAIYDYALSPERVAAHHSAGRGSPTDPTSEGNVVVVERYQGNANRVEVITANSETPYPPGQVAAALQEIKPAGMTFFTTIGYPQSFNRVRLKHADFAAAKAAYATFRDMRNVLEVAGSS
jgi:hypothetical protein